MLGLNNALQALEARLSAERVALLARIQELEHDLDRSGRLVTELSSFNLDRLGNESVVSFMSGESGGSRARSAARKSRVSTSTELVPVSVSLGPIDPEDDEVSPISPVRKASPPTCTSPACTVSCLVLYSLPFRHLTCRSDVRETHWLQLVVLFVCCLDVRCVLLLL